LVIDAPAIQPLLLATRRKRVMDWNGDRNSLE
jgi:hypothetical protein